MNKYGQTAVRAVQLLQAGMSEPEAAWKQAAKEMFPESEASRAKVCPKAAFLGLCSAGLINGVPRALEVSGTDGLNARYARNAVELLQSEPHWATEKAGEVWKEVMRRLGNAPSKRANGQMDVVLALWANGLIC
ncbi:MAG: hypothetical protein AB7E72_00045 [Lysobacterales bacterium]